MDRRASFEDKESFKASYNEDKLRSIFKVKTIGQRNKPLKMSDPAG
jgi:hypothetical protein